MTRVINGLIPYFYEGKLSGEVFVDGKPLKEIPSWERGNNFTEPAPKEVTDFEIGNYRFNPVTQRLSYTGWPATAPETGGI